MDDLAENARRVIALRDARLMMDGAPAEVFARGAELREAGLDVPCVAQIAAALAARGRDIPKGVIKLDDLQRCVESMLGGRP
jgi:hypothetical protein